MALVDADEEVSPGLREEILTEFREGRSTTGLVDRIIRTIADR